MSKKATEFQKKEMSKVYRGKEIFKLLNAGWTDENVACMPRMDNTEGTQRTAFCEVWENENLCFRKRKIAGYFVAAGYLLSLEKQLWSCNPVA